MLLGDYLKVSVWRWLGVLALSAVPGVNIVLWFVWAFAAKRPPIKTFAIAALILTAIILALLAVLIMVFGDALLKLW